jgi:uncharacterized membrane protein YgaE (UPF0421/DUF939 family)
MSGVTRVVTSLRSPARTPLLQVAKASIAAIAAWIVCDLIYAQPPIFAAIAALLVVQPSVNQTLSKGVERSVGVIVGVLLAFGVGFVFGTASWAVLTTIVIALLISWALRLGPGSANQIPISAMLVLSIGALTPQYAVERIVETIIGAAIGFVVNIAIVPPVQLRPAHLAVQRLVRELAGDMESLAAALTSRTDPNELQTMLVRARDLRGLRDKAEDALANGRESLQLNPRGGRLRRVLARDEALFARLSVLVTRVLGMTRTVRDHYDPALTDDPVVVSLAEELRRAAHDLRLVGRDIEGTEPAPVTSELPALTRPLSVLVPHPEHWVLIGSLLEDLRRVREEITGEGDAR